MNPSRRRRLSRAVSILALALLAVPARAEPLRRFELPAGPLAERLADVARLAGIDVAAPAAALEGRAVAPLAGALTPAAALERLIAGQGLELVRTGERSFAVRASEAAPAAEAARPGDDEIVVTGTRIRGAGPIGAPVRVLGEAEIASSGYATVEALAASLPSNFGGGAGEDNRSGTVAGTNVAGGTAINLRGLGADATLVLVNGRRAPQGGGISGAFVDISSIPLAAIERVEVLADGASAIYGADAVAGVVNFVLRRDLEGLETRARYGVARDAAEQAFSLTGGGALAAGRWLAGLDYWHRDALANADRRFARSSNLTELGGSDFRTPGGNPGNIVSPALAALPAGQPGIGLTRADLRLGQSNRHDANQGQALLPRQERLSAILSAAHDIGSAEAFLDARVGRRWYTRFTAAESRVNEQVTSANPFFVSPVAGGRSVLIQYNLIDDLGPVTDRGHVTTIDTAAGLTAPLGRGWAGEAYAQFAREITKNRRSNIVNNAAFAEALGTPLGLGQPDRFPNFDPRVDGFFNPFGDGSNTPANVLRFIEAFADDDVTATGYALNLKADGPLFRLPGGDAKLALGLEARREGFVYAGFGNVSTPFPEPRAALAADERRDVVAGFAELLLPLVGDANGTAGLRELTLSAAARIERYSDFGTTTNPRVGVRWKPVDALALRASYGTSFNAPQLADLSPARALSFIFDLPNAQGTRTRALVLSGANPDLEPETARILTAGIDLAPRGSGLTLSAGAFDIAYKNRIDVAGVVTTFLLDPILYAPVIRRDPDDALVERFIASPGFVRFGPVPPAASVEAVLDGRLFNLARVRVRGLDAQLGYRFDGFGGTFDAGVDATWLLDLKQRLLPAAPVREVLDTLGFPIDLKARGRLAFTRGKLSAAAHVNYADAYRDTVSQPGRRIGGWTTVDLRLAYAFGDDAGLLSNTSLALSAQNLFDADPPFANNPAGIGYDPNNADPLGRLVALELRKRF